VLELVRPSLDLRDAFLEMYRDYEEGDSKFYDSLAADFEAELEQLERAHRGEVRSGLVAWTSFFLRREDGLLLGGCRLRHALSDSLWQDGGHIGYDIRPSRRNRGYATRMLALALDKARERGLEWVLLTISPYNKASIRVAEKNGARCIGVADQSGNLRFRIDLGGKGIL
jgi:predicted acetyltransferase